MPHESCCLCSKRIPSNIKKKNRVGQPKLWKSFKKYVKNSGRTFEPHEFICKRCENKIRDLNELDNRNVEAEPMEWTFDNDFELASNSDHEPLPQNDSENSTSNSERRGPFSDVANSSQESSQNITMSSVTENSQISSFSSQAPSQNSSINTQRMSEFIIPGIATCIKTQSYGFICRNPKGRWRIPKSALMDAWLTRRIRILNENRCCRNHLENGVFTKNALMNINAINEDMETSGPEIAQWIIELTDEANRNNSTVDFSPSTSLTSADYEMLLGVSKDNFAVLFGYLKDTVRNSINRTAHDALAIFLMKLRLNLSQRVIAFLFGITNQSVISETIEIVSKALEEKFVPKFLGYQHLNREEIMNQHMRPFFTIVLGLNEEDMILILDGTYLYVQKASDFKLQRQTFSLHKHRNLFKPMMIVCPDGYILEADGLYFADAGNNDAKILNRILDQPDSLLSILQERDALVLDRGFRDILGTIERAGCTSFMPSLLKKNSKQFTMLEANQSRNFTMLRWVVEAANGRLKMFIC